MIFYRICIFIINLIFPPLAVVLMKGLGSPETILNACLFVLAVIPSHVHAFLISWQYFAEESRLQKERRSARRRRHRDKLRVRGTSRSSCSTCSPSPSSSAAGEYGRRRSRRDDKISRGVVEEYDAESLYEEPRRQRYITRGASQKAIPPPCPDPPSGYQQRYLE